MTKFLDLLRRVRSFLPYVEAALEALKELDGAADRVGQKLAGAKERAASDEE